MNKVEINFGIPVIEYDGETYPKFQTEGFAAQFAFPFAIQVCKGTGVDVGCGHFKWALPSSDERVVHCIDPKLNIGDATHFGALYDLDFIFSSHCLEHIPYWVDVLNYWTEKLRTGGVLFLYLPDYSQKYWRPWNNRKHVNIFTPQIIKDYLTHAGYENIFVSGIDLYNSFMVMAQKGFTCIVDVPIHTNGVK